MERRKHQRLSVRLAAELWFADGSCYRVLTRNLSLGGAFVLGAMLEGRAGERCTLHLQVQQEPAQPPIRLHGRIVHDRSEGHAIGFVASSAEDYQRFVELLRSHSPHPEWLQRELSGGPGFVREIA